MAEMQHYPHKLTMKVTISRALLRQRTTALGAYKQNSESERKLTFASVSGKNWVATYEHGHFYYGDDGDHIVFEINH